MFVGRTIIENHWEYWTSAYNLTTLHAARMYVHYAFSCSHSDYIHCVDSSTVSFYNLRALHDRYNLSYY